MDSPANEQANSLLPRRGAAIYAARENDNVAKERLFVPCVCVCAVPAPEILFRVAAAQIILSRARSADRYAPKAD